MILIIDDERLVCRTLERLLEDLGYQSEYITDPREAVARFSDQANRFDAVILDISMPVMGGLECLRKLQQVDPDVRVVVSTAHTLQGETTKLLNEGAVGYIQKPYQLDQLTKTLADLNNSCR